MKTIIELILGLGALIGSVSAISHFGLLGWIFAGFLVVLIYGSRYWVNHLLEIRRHRRMIENIYVYSLHENDRNVMKHARHHQYYLELAGNYVDDKGTRHGNGVQVLAIIFQDSMCGKYPNAPGETWEEFQERLDLIIRTDRIKRHGQIDTEDKRSFYLKQVLRQV